MISDGSSPKGHPVVVVFVTCDAAVEVVVDVLPLVRALVCVVATAVVIVTVLVVVVVILRLGHVVVCSHVGSRHFVSSHCG